MTAATDDLCNGVAQIPDLDAETLSLIYPEEQWAFIDGTGCRFILTDLGRVISVARISPRDNNTPLSVRAKVLTIGRHSGTRQRRVNLSLGHPGRRKTLYLDDALQLVFGHEEAA